MTEYLPKDNKQYKKKEYWDGRFHSEESYDWLARYENVAGLLAQYVKKSDRILMYEAGYHQITNIDFSQVVIERMSAKYSEEMPEMKWIVADMTKLGDVFSVESFDVVIDKAAMDALMVGWQNCDEGDVWSPSERVIEQGAMMCHGITSILMEKGTFLQISFGQPHFRKRFLLGEGYEGDVSRTYGWSYKYHNIDIGLGYFFYVMQKLPDRH